MLEKKLLLFWQIIAFLLLILLIVSLVFFLRWNQQMLSTVQEQSRLMTRNSNLQLEILRESQTLLASKGPMEFQAIYGMTHPQEDQEESLPDDPELVGVARQYGNNEPSEANLERYERRLVQGDGPEFEFERT